MIPGVNPNNLPGRLADLVRVPIDYILEVHVNGKLYRGLSTTLPNVPGNYSYVRQSATSTDPTLTEDVIREHGTPRFASHSISGETGLKARSGYDRKGNIIFKSGPEVLQEFDEFLKEYQRIASAKGGQDFAAPSRKLSDGAVLIFRALAENVHARVEVGSFKWDRSATRYRHSYAWSLQLEEYAPAKRKVPTSLLAPLDSWANKAREAIAEVNALGAVVSNALVNARGDLDELRGPLQELQRTGQVAAQIMQGAGSIAQFPADVLSDLAACAESFANAWNEADIVAKTARRSYLEGGATKDFTDRLRRIGWLAADSARNTATVAGAVGVGPSQRRSGDQSRADTRMSLTGQTRRLGAGRRGSVRNAGAYQMRVGDTLQSIAAGAYGSAARWVEIAYHNGFPDATTDASGAPLRAGTVILLPGVSDGEPVERASTADALFGRDLYSDPVTGDYEWAGGDIRTVSGYSNLTQAIRNRMTTSQGESRGFPAYGLPVAPGDVVNARVAAYTAAHVREQMAADPRVSDVPRLRVIDGGDRLDIAFDVEPNAGGSLTVVAPMTPAG